MKNNQSETREEYDFYSIPIYNPSNTRTHVEDTIDKILVGLGYAYQNTTFVPQERANGEINHEVQYPDKHYLKTLDDRVVVALPPKDEDLFTVDFPACQRTINAYINFFKITKSMHSDLLKKFRPLGVSHKAAYDEGISPFMYSDF